MVRTFRDIHEDHINLSRFSNLSKDVFGTSSFDKTVKLWDVRVRGERPAVALGLSSLWARIDVRWCYRVRASAPGAQR